MRNNPIFYCQAINKLRPGAGFGLDGTDYETLTCADESIIQPSKEEIEFEYDLIEQDYNAKTYQRQRENEYPDFKDYLDAVVKGDQNQIQSYIDACLAVKAKYPKP